MTYQSPVEKQRAIKAKPQPELGRKQLRDDINVRYENSLRYLGR